MYLIFVLACTCFCIYGLGIALDKHSDNHLENGLPILISNVLCVLFACITLIYKFNNLKNAKASNLTELEYWKKHHEKQ
jgi:uncharacterized protein with PQ loop repeat